MTRLFPALVLGIALLVAGCGTVGRTTEGNLSTGKQLFSENCGSCHTLEDAGTQGMIGPNLDNAFAAARSDDAHQGFDESTIREVVRGQIAYPVVDPVTDAPGMPKDIVEGADADAVASYVAAVAGVPASDRPQVGGGSPSSGPGPSAGDDPEAIFASAGCGGCHTFEAAESTGEIGPNLDDAQPSVELAVDRITNGKGTMPAFKDQLSDKQIRAVARWVSENAAK